MNPIRLLTAPALIFTSLTPAFAHQATEIKLTGPTAESIAIWTRITRDAGRAPDDGPRPITKLFDRKTGKEVPLRDNATYAAFNGKVYAPDLISEQSRAFVRANNDRPFFCYVPTLVRWPGRIAPGTTTVRVSGFEDWLPTILEFAGATARTPRDVDGISLVPTLLGRT